MIDNPIFLIGISAIFAFVPVIIWLTFLFKKAEKSKKTIALVFLLGCLTAPALLGLQYAWDLVPRFNLAAFIENNITEQSKMYIAMFVLFGAMEEIIKMIVISSIDKRTVLINTINDSIRYSFVSALGFSFTENIYYMYEFWNSISTGALIGMFIFRSSFTAAAHMIFSGIFGYYYGVGKFSFQITRQQKLVGEKNKITHLISKIFKLSTSQAHQQKLIFKGLLIAIGMHATYNYLLQYNKTLPVMIFVILGFLFLQFLLKRKSGHLVLETDITAKRKSTMAPRDEEVVTELISMWFKEKKYVDVIHICERLLERDPDNTVVQIFKAKAMDQMENTNIYKKILGSILPSKTVQDESLIRKHLEEKEMFNKVQTMIKEQLEKEGKKYQEYKEEAQQSNESQEKTNTPSDTFQVEE
ncbi:hypothetical protein COU74_03460 [Candidatus Peregrinibacteria bacterium CG10_big_fil_rev_8_21_14_0_10_36_19]|nr:MAG: hypothetical protein COU74_03460 [Candidatus Peregrinibacteria bacterium CG10_big_fil_rev_8_21_14_0_10_36_19]